MLTKLKSAGGIMALFGVITAALSLMGHEPWILGWIDNWGTAVGWVIRVGLMLVGTALFLVIPGDSERENVPWTGP